MRNPRTDPDHRPFTARGCGCLLRQGSRLAIGERGREHRAREHLQTHPHHVGGRRIIVDAQHHRRRRGGDDEWNALAGSVHDVLANHRNSAQFGLMAFPAPVPEGEIDSGCAAGTVRVPMDVNTATAIDEAIATTVIASNHATPAGQTLMAASTLEQLTDDAYENFVIFISDGWQYCNLSSGEGATPTCSSEQDAMLMGLEASPQCNACASTEMTGCSEANVDGCYCVRGLAGQGRRGAEGGRRHDVCRGFGSGVDGQTLNRAAAAGGDAPESCNPEAQEASCYLKAESGIELVDALAKIMHRVTTEDCPGDCSIKGQRQCTLQGWTECVAPDTVSCDVDCGEGEILEGTSSCVENQLTECSAQCSQGSGGGGTGGAAQARAVAMKAARRKAVEPRRRRSRRRRSRWWRRSRRPRHRWRAESRSERRQRRGSLGQRRLRRRWRLRLRRRRLLRRRRRPHADDDRHEDRRGRRRLLDDGSFQRRQRLVARARRARPRCLLPSPRVNQAKSQRIPFAEGNTGGCEAPARPRPLWGEPARSHPPLACLTAARRRGGTRAPAPARNDETRLDLQPVQMPC